MTLEHWRGTGNNTSLLHQGITHQYSSFPDGMAAFYKALKNQAKVFLDTNGSVPLNTVISNISNKKMKSIKTANTHMGEDKDASNELLIVNGMLRKR